MDSLPTTVARTFGYVMLLVVVIVAFLTIRLMDDAKESLKSATFALETGNRDIAADHLEDAAKSYVPGSPYPRKALRDLAIMARAAEIRGEMSRALALWESIRRSLISTRHIVQPNSDILSEAEQNIVRLRNDPAPQDEAVNLVERPADPSPVLSVLIAVGLLIWIGGTATICYLVTAEQAFPFSKKLYLLGASGLGFAMWLVAAYFV